MNGLNARSFWFLGHVFPSYPPLPGDRDVDVAVVGAGITGLTAALCLKQAGKQVAVLEAGGVGSGATGGSSAHLDVHPEQGFDRLLSDFGEESARKMTDARRDAVDQIEAWCRQFQIECDFQRIPAYLYAEDDDGRKQIHRQYDAAHLLWEAAEQVEEIPFPIPCTAALRLNNQARFHPLHYLHGLAAQVHGGLGAVYENTRVASPPTDGKPCTIETNQGQVRANQVILATHSAFLGISTLDARVAAYQSYVLTAELEDEIADGLFWDMASPYHYIRRANSVEPHVAIIGGEDHKTGQADEKKHAERLEEYVRGRFRVRNIRQRWSAELFESADGGPLIGRAPLSSNLYFATGFSGVGLTWGTAAGKLLADQLLGRDNPLSEVVSPARWKPLVSGAALVQENLNAAKHFVLDRFGLDGLEAWEEMGLDEGRTLKHHGDLVAVYKDPSGLLHACSAKCTHADCVVQWNGFEKTWDCPCHGGRFDCHGRRLYGPPPGDLRPVHIPTPRPDRPAD